MPGAKYGLLGAFHMSHLKNPGNTKHLRDGHWFVEIYGTC
jgi:hypothetical protein